MATRKFELKKPIIGIDGQPMYNQQNGIQDPEPLMLNRNLANNLVQQSTGEPMKLYGWAQELWKEGTLTIDKPDLDMLKNIIKGMAIIILVKAQLLEVFDEPEKPVAVEEK